MRDNQIWIQITSILFLLMTLEDPKKKILWAAENNYMDIAKSSLDEDPSLVNSRDSDLYTPLHRACYNGHADMVKVHVLIFL